MADKMRAVVLYGPGDIRVEDWDMPLPAAGEVLIRVIACGVCGSDLPRINALGAYYHPIVPGHEFAGEVVALGKGVEGLAQGDRVTVMPLEPCMRCAFCQIGEYTMCENYGYYGSRRDGAFAQFIAVKAWNCVKLPDNVSFVVGAMVDPAAVALHAIRRGQLDFGASATVFGAGPIGLFATELLKLRGCGTLCVVDMFDEKFELLRSLELPGKVVEVDSRKGDAIEAIFEATDGKGSDFVIDTAGSPVTQALAIDAAAKLGHIVYVGSANGDVDVTKARFEKILRRQLSLYGSWNSSIKPFPVNEWETILAYMASGQLKAEPLVSHRISLDEAPDALKWMYARDRFFSKVIIEPWQN